MAEPDELLTVAEVAAELKLHEETIRRWIRDGKLRAIHLGSTHAGYRVRRSDLALFLAQPRNPQQPELPTKRAAGKLLAA